MNKNCWEVKSCKVKENCPAYPKFGRICFSIEGTLCGGEVQGVYKEKIQRCRKCEFYDQTVRQAA